MVNSPPVSQSPHQCGEFNKSAVIGPPRHKVPHGRQEVGFAHTKATVEIDTRLHR